jgi:hypothetical protein
MAEKVLLSRYTQAPCILLLAAICLLASGCGASGSVSTVEGSVTVDDMPIPSGKIVFTPLESTGAQAISVDILDGKYHSTEVPRGKLLANVIAMQDTGEKHIEFGIEYPKPKNLVPDKYVSGIELTVDAPTMTHDFKLSSK